MRKQHPHAALGFGAVLIVGSCQSVATTPQPDSALLTLHAAQSCASSLPPFGHFRYPGERLDQYMPANGAIALDNDGGWCWIDHVQYWYSVRITPDMHITVPPAHGDVLLGAVDGKLRIAYRPVPGFSGDDNFQIRLGGPDPFDVPVHVTVTH